MPTRKLIATLVTTLACAAAGSAWAAAAQGDATAEEATAMVKKAVAHIKAGKDKAYADITTKGGAFSSGDLYITVYGLDGTVRAHGANEKMVGKNLIDLKDVDGKEIT